MSNNPSNQRCLSNDRGRSRATLLVVLALIALAGTWLWRSSRTSNPADGSAGIPATSGEPFPYPSLTAAQKGTDPAQLAAWAGIPAADVAQAHELQWKRSGRIETWWISARSGWVTSQRVPVQAQLDPWLSRLASDKARRLVIAPELQERYRAALMAQSDRHVVLRLPKAEIEIRAGRVEDRMVAISSAQPGKVFEVFPETILNLGPPRGTASP